jgi:hypothetical protein
VVDVTMPMLSVPLVGADPAGRPETLSRTIATAALVVMWLLRVIVRKKT